MSNPSLEERSLATARLDRDFRHHPALGFGPASRFAETDQPSELPVCDRCGSAMAYLGRIPPGRLSTGKLVFRCYTCSRVISLPPTA